MLSWLCRRLVSASGGFSQRGNTMRPARAEIDPGRKWRDAGVVLRRYADWSCAGWHGSTGGRQQASGEMRRDGRDGWMDEALL